MSYLPRIAILIDLPRDKASGGHVKYWERVAQAAVAAKPDLDLTFYFSGKGDDEILSPHIRYRYLPPVFSTANLKFLPYVPAHTDLAPFHPRLAQELPDYDVVHTTDAFFAFARTAERVMGWNHMPLITSFHTDTPAYAELFTRQTLLSLFGNIFGRSIDNLFSVSKRERVGKEKRLCDHLRKCAAIFAMRFEDTVLVPADKLKPMRLGVDKDLFVPNPSARDEINARYHIAADKFMVLFVGRVDAGKNMPLLLQACLDARARGVRLQLVVAGLGPMDTEIKTKLGVDATLVGQVEPLELAKLYAAADCLAIASDIEIGGMIGLEALACGCPVLVSKLSGVAQLCGNTDAMQLVDSNPAAWTDAIVALTQDKDKQKMMRDAALVYRAEKLADWADVLNDFVPVWQNFVRRK